MGHRPPLGNLCQCLTTLTVKNFFLISSLHLRSFSLKLLPLVLLQWALIRSLSAASNQWEPFPGLQRGDVSISKQLCTPATASTAIQRVIQAKREKVLTHYCKLVKCHADDVRHKTDKANIARYNR